MGGDYIYDEYSGNGKPYWSPRHESDRRILDNRQLNIGNAPVWTKQGVYFREDSAIRTSNVGNNNLETINPYTVIMWVYVLNIDQES